MVTEFQIHEFLNSVDDSEGRLFAKRLAANDTLATGSHQAGLYIPNEIAFRLFPSLLSADAVNPRVEFDAEIVSHGQAPKVLNIIWYNQKTRNECHVTRWGGSSSPLLDPEATGSLCLFAFYGSHDSDVSYCKVWICSNIYEEDNFESRFDIVEPGAPLFLNFSPSSLAVREPTLGYTVAEEQLGLWSQMNGGIDFPTGKELIDLVLQKLPDLVKLPVDKRLLRRREAEYIEFRRIERAVILPQVRDGFDDMDKFVSYANSVTNRRKSRAGKSLELHMEVIFREQGITGFAYDKITERHKRPDFVFPSIEAYLDPKFDKQKLRMLACKTTCKDRWRQVVDEASRINEKHLLTLQQGVSENQHQQMKEAGIKLVVPKEIRQSYPKSVRAEIGSVENFISELKGLSN